MTRSHTRFAMLGAALAIGTFVRVPVRTAAA